ncbi:hypothetical protein [Mycolicibacterium sp. HS_4_1]
MGGATVGKGHVSTDPVCFDVAGRLPTTVALSSGMHAIAFWMS